MEYELIRSARRTLSVEVKPDGRIVVRAPLTLSKRRIDRFLLEREEWIEDAQRKYEKRNEALLKIDKLSEKEIRDLKNEARRELTALCEEYADIMGLDYNRVSIRTQRTRWGSCSRDRNLNFNALLMLAPEGARRYVVVHELCHLWEMNHSKRFWDKVSKYCPDWRYERRWLKKNGDALIARLPD
ncbi:MAG: M48 family metallopeptidase [Lachnospiraceae bacterium]|nr:M48 family metallopeptidase [Lachnospiraceae bacterium]